jgi:RNA polymerase sigma factor for flagellar operon FliA
MSENVNEELIIQYQQTKDDSLKVKLVEKYGYIVKTIVRQMQSAYVRDKDIEDIVSEGFCAMLKAFDTYDADKNVKFETYVSIRVRGAAIDYLRKLDWTPRRVKKNEKLLDKAHSEMFTILGRHPTEEELAGHMGITIEELRKMTLEVDKGNVISLNEMLYETEQTSIGEEIFSDNNIYNPEKSLEKKELYDIMYTAIQELSEREKTIISLYYNKNLKIREIAYVLNISEARVSQISTNAIRKLRCRLAKYRETE